MKKLMMTCAVVMAMAAPAMAEDGPAKEGGRPPHPPRMFEMADTNKDGKVSKAEFDARQAKFFSEIDKNGDGAITPEEMKAHREGMREKMKAWRAEHGGKDGPDGEGKDPGQAPDATP